MVLFLCADTAGMRCKKAADSNNVICGKCTLLQLASHIICDNVFIKVKKMVDNA